MSDDQMMNQRLSDHDLEQICAGFSPLVLEGDITWPDNGARDGLRDKAGGDKPTQIVRAKGEPLRTIQ